MVKKIRSRFGTPTRNYIITEKTNAIPVGRSSLISLDGKQLLQEDTTKIKRRKRIR